jgi:hypothetical protein
MNTYHIKSRTLEMRIGEPISTAGLTGHDMQALSDKVQKAVCDLYYGTVPSKSAAPSRAS